MPLIDIRFHAVGKPIGQPRPRAFARKMGNKFVARVYDAGTAEEWKSIVAVAARSALPSAPIGVPVRVELEFAMPRPVGHFGSGRNAAVLKSSSPSHPVGKPDLDNLAKAVLDALTQIGMWADDSLVVSLCIHKCYADNAQQAGVDVLIRSV